MYFVTWNTILRFPFPERKSISRDSGVGRERERERERAGTEFYSKNPTPNGSRPRGLIGHWRMSTQETPPPRTHKEGQGGQGKPNRQKATGEGRSDNRGSTAARPTLTRDWGGPQVRDPTPIVSVNPEADPPQPRAPVRPNQAGQDGETAEEKSQKLKKYVIPAVATLVLNLGSLASGSFS